MANEPSMSRWPARGPAPDADWLEALARGASPSLTRSSATTIWRRSRPSSDGSRKSWVRRAISMCSRPRCSARYGPAVPTTKSSPRPTAIVQQQRMAAYARAAAAARSSRFRGAMLGLAEWIETGPWTVDEERTELRARPVAEYAKKKLARLRKWIKRKGADLRHRSVSQRHRLRIRAKRLRYATEFFAATFPDETSAKRRTESLAALKDLQDALGDLNDLATRHALMVDSLGDKAKAVEQATTDGSGRMPTQKQRLCCARPSRPWPASPIPNPSGKRKAGARLSLRQAARRDESLRCRASSWPGLPAGASRRRRRREWRHTRPHGRDPWAWSDRPPRPCRAR